MHHHNMLWSLTRGAGPQKASSRLSGGYICTILQVNFYEKALFVKGDLATDRSVANATALPFALCFYPHFRGAHALVARCI